MSVELLSTMSVAVLSSFSHCYAMCGGLNLAFLQCNKEAKSPFLLSLTYHLFRILAYVFLGLIFVLFGKVFALFNAKILLFVLGFFMLFLGLALIFRGKILALLERPFIFNLFAKRLWQKMNFKGVKSAVVLGFCNGFMPCGLVYFALALAMSEKSLLNGALIMLVFGLCTLPALLFFNKFFHLLGQKRIFNSLSAFIIMAQGAYLLYLGAAK